jgi:hypothetical protein
MKVFDGIRFKGGQLKAFEGVNSEASDQLWSGTG